MNLCINFHIIFYSTGHWVSLYTNPPLFLDWYCTCSLSFNSWVLSQLSCFSLIPLYHWYLGWDNSCFSYRLQKYNFNPSYPFWVLCQILHINCDCISVTLVGLDPTWKTIFQPNVLVKYLLVFWMFVPTPNYKTAPLMVPVRATLSHTRYFIHLSICLPHKLYLLVIVLCFSFWSFWTSIKRKALLVLYEFVPFQVKTLVFPLALRCYPSMTGLVPLKLFHLLVLFFPCWSMTSW